jgi:glycosyltransferase involved in cell wall biosynthesis
MKPKVTIGICVKNGEETIASALESITAQSYPHQLIEILLVDDGSEDNTLKVVKQCLSTTDILSQVFSDSWRGLGKARNIVIREASGNYIIWVDADEILANDFVARQVDMIENNPKAGVVSGRLSILEHENVILALDLIPNVVEYSRQDWKSAAKLPGTGGTTYRVAAARQVGGFDEELSGLGEDIEIASRMREAGWQVIRGEGVFYEKHGNLTTWMNLLKRSVSQGVQSRRLYRKTDQFYSLLKMNPLASALAGVLYAVQGYKVTRRKVVLLLPPHFCIKMLAWFYGFCKG